MSDRNVDDCEWWELCGICGQPNEPDHECVVEPAKGDGDE